MRFVTIGATKTINHIRSAIANSGNECYDIPLVPQNTDLLNFIDLYEINNCDAVIIFGTWGSDFDKRQWHPTNNLRRQAWLNDLNTLIANYCKSINKPLIVMETSTLSRIRLLYSRNTNWKEIYPRYYRVGLNHWTYGLATFCKAKDTKRLEVLINQFPAMKEQILRHKWNNNKDGYILICPGLENDPTSIIPVDQFVKNSIEDIRKVTDRKICIKPHPFTELDFSDLGVEIIDKEKSIQDISPEVYCCIIDSSTSIFEIITLGIPCITSTNSFGAPLKNTEINNIENLYYANEKEVLEWYTEMSYTEYTIQQIQHPNMITRWIKELVNGQNTRST